MYIHYFESIVFFNVNQLNKNSLNLEPEKTIFFKPKISKRNYT